MTYKSGRPLKSASSEEEMAIQNINNRVILAELKARLSEARLRELKASTEYNNLKNKTNET